MSTDPGDLVAQSTLSSASCLEVSAKIASVVNHKVKLADYYLVSIE
jgi:hypothetical protein